MIFYHIIKHLNIPNKEYIKNTKNKSMKELKNVGNTLN